MSPSLRGLTAAFAAGLAVSAPAESASREPDQDVDVRVLESRLADALHRRDREQLESLLAADYVLRGAPDIDRETWLRNAIGLCWGDRSDIDDFRAQHYDGVVISSFALTFYVDPGTCRAGVLRSLVTDVWVREADGWKLKVRHAGPPGSAGDIAAQYGVVPVPPPIWEASTEFSAVATGGNTSTRTIGLGARIAHTTDRQKTEMETRFLTSQADEVTNARSLIVEGRHGFRVTRQLEIFGEAAYARDRFAGIDDRAAATAGVGYTVVGRAPQSLVLEGGFGGTFEQRLDRTSLRFTTAAGALDYRWTIAPATELREELAVNLDLESSENWRTSNRVMLSVTLTQVLSLRASHWIEYRHAPVAGFGRSDIRTAMTLVVSTARRPTIR